MKWYYIINIGGHSLLQVEVHEGGVRAAYAVYYGLMRGFPVDMVTIHEIGKNLATGETTVKKLNPKPPTKR